MFTSKRRQDPLQNDLLVHYVKTVSKGKDSAKYLGAVELNSNLHQVARFFREVL